MFLPTWWLKLMIKIKIIFNPLHFKESTDQGLYTHNLIISKGSFIFLLYCQKIHILIDQQGRFDGRGSPTKNKLTFRVIGS